ncbi:hypothetical protein ACH5RR_029706 [Cinchona calisaya]|uniref:Uncharacterized protein n=1 Tax=Cinchona calisaya TaxID=153742 RepID=A0ABD2YSE9_9GENT
MASNFCESSIPVFDMSTMVRPLPVLLLLCLATNALSVPQGALFMSSLVSRSILNLKMLGLKEMPRLPMFLIQTLFLLLLVKMEKEMELTLVEIQGRLEKESK